MIIVDKSPIIIIYANYINKTVFFNKCGNVPSIVQQISNTVEFSTNIILVTDLEHKILLPVLNAFIDTTKLNILNSTEFLYFIASLNNLHIIFIDACVPNINKELLTNFITMKQVRLKCVFIMPLVLKKTSSFSLSFRTG